MSDTTVVCTDSPWAHTNTIALPNSNIVDPLGGYQKINSKLLQNLHSRFLRAFTAGTYWHHQCPPQEGHPFSQICEKIKMSSIGRVVGFPCFLVIGLCASDVISRLSESSSYRPILLCPSIYSVVQKVIPLFYFCDNFCKCTPILTIFHYCNKKCMTHKSKITLATSPLFCNHPT